MSDRKDELVVSVDLDTGAEIGPVDIGLHKGSKREVNDDPTEELRKRASEFSKAAGDLADSIGKFALKKSEEIKGKLDEDAVHEKIATNIKEVTNKIDDYLDSDIKEKTIPVKGVFADESGGKNNSKSVNDCAGVVVETEVVSINDDYSFESVSDYENEPRGVIDSLRDEIKERASENKALKKAVDNEKRRLEKAREEAKKNNVFRKIKVVDSAIAKKEVERDERALAAYRSKEEAKIQAARADRSDELIRKNKKPLAIVAGVLVLLFAGVNGVSTHSNNVALANAYDEAVECIVDEKYDEASEKLEDMSVNDSHALHDYAELQSDISAYKGNPHDFLEKMTGIDGIENESVKKQYKDACAEIKTAEIVQSDIESIDVSSVSAISEDKITSISNEEKNLEDRYEVLLDTEKYDLASAVISNKNNNTDAWKLISELENLGDVSLESKDTINSLRTTYDGLSEDDKKIILNYGVLTSAESKYADLQKEEDARIAAEKKAAEEKAEQERLAAAAAERENTQMVWISRTGHKYHSNPNCSNMKNPSQVSLSYAQSMNLGPCSKCY